MRHVPLSRAALEELGQHHLCWQQQVQACFAPLVPLVQEALPRVVVWAAVGQVTVLGAASQREPLQGLLPLHSSLACQLVRA